MKRLAAVILIVVFVFLSIKVVRAAGTGDSLDWWTVDSGGATSQGGNYSLTGTIGQAETGTTRGGSYSLVSGFWAALHELWEKIFLPLVLRS